MLKFHSKISSEVKVSVLKLYVTALNVHIREKHALDNYNLPTLGCSNYILMFVSVAVSTRP